MNIKPIVLLSRQTNAITKDVSQSYDFNNVGGTPNVTLSVTIPDDCVLYGFLAAANLNTIHTGGASVSYISSISKNEVGVVANSGITTTPGLTCYENLSMLAGTELRKGDVFKFYTQFTPSAGGITANVSLTLVYKPLNVTQYVAF